MKKSLAVLKCDKYLARLVKKYGPPDLNWGGKKQKKKKDSFQALTRSIIYQQISGKAGESILKKFIALFGKFPTPKQALTMPIKKLRSAGLSPQKATYIKDLAKKFNSGIIKHKKLHTLKNEEVIEHLVQVKGIGVWTAHMFLIFTLNRPNVLPTGDLGIQKGFKKVYGLRSLPTHQKMETLAKPWREHASYASWYFWRVADDNK